MSSAPPSADPPNSPSAAGDALPAGSTLGGDFRIERVLSEGALGHVYLAIDLLLRRPVAIREYLPLAHARRGPGRQVQPRQPADAEAFARGRAGFVETARRLAQFDHPALPRVLRCWEADGTAYLALPQHDGPTLFEARRAMQRPPDRGWVERQLLAPLLDALEQLHRAGWLHRDLSPHQVMLAGDGRPLLLDFDAAAPLPPAEAGAPPAPRTPGFAPIEQYARSDALPEGPWSDLYALGALAWFAVSGEAPPPATVRAIDDRLPSAEALAERLGREHPGWTADIGWLQALRRALAVAPAERPQSVLQWRALLLQPPPPPPAALPAAAASGPPTAAANDADAADDGSDPALDEAHMQALIRKALGDLPPRPAPVPASAAADPAPSLIERSAQAPRLVAATAAAPEEAERPLRPPASGHLWRGAAAVLAAGLLAVAAGALWQWQERTERDDGLARTLETSPPAAGPTRAAAPVETPPPPAAAAVETVPPPVPAAPVVAASAPAASAPPAVTAEREEAPPPAAKAAEPAPPASPRAACAGRSNFSLDYCLQRQCAQPRFKNHADCRAN